MNDRLVHFVDDDLSVRESLRWLLVTADVWSCVYETPQSLLGLTGGRPEGCVLLDMRMPGTDGVRGLKTLARHGMTAPVIAITGHGDGVDASEARHLGAADFIEKPFSADRLSAATERALAGAMMAAAS